MVSVCSSGVHMCVVCCVHVGIDVIVVGGVVDGHASSVSMSYRGC